MQDDSDVLSYQPSEPAVLKVYQTGALTVVGFGGADVPQEHNLAEYRDRIVELIRQYNCQEFAFDLTGVRLIPSGTLGLIASIRDQGVKVSIYNPSPDVREVLELTRLDQVIHVCEVDLG